jgi:ABC-type phosphate transport system permease subunit
MNLSLVLTLLTIVIGVPSALLSSLYLKDWWKHKSKPN